MEDKGYISKKVSEVYEKIDELSNATNEFKEKLQTLLKGMCRQREQEIDKAEQVIEQNKIRQAEEPQMKEEEWDKKRVQEVKKWREEGTKIRAQIETERREEERIKAEQDKRDKVQEIIFKAERNPENAKNLNSQITNAYQQLLNTERIYKQKADILGIAYTKVSSNTKIAERVKAIQDTIVQVQEVVDNLNVTENDSQETVAEKSKRVIPLVDGIAFGAIQAEDLSKIVNLHMTQSETEIKRNLYNKVQKTIQNAKIQKYMAEKEEISNKKIGFLGKLTGKQKLQDEKINQLNLKIQLAQTTEPQEKGKYSVKDMLADMKVCAKTDFDGNLTPEMLNLYTTIKQNFGTKEKQAFSEEKIEDLANNKIRQQQNKFLVPFQNPPSFFGRTKFQLDSLKQENMALKSQIMEEIQKGNMSYVKLSDPVDAIAAFDSKLDKIQRITTEQKQIDKDGPTAEL